MRTTAFFGQRSTIIVNFLTLFQEYKMLQLVRQAEILDSQSMNWTLIIMILQSQVVPDNGITIIIIIIRLRFKPSQ